MDDLSFCLDLNMRLNLHHSESDNMSHRDRCISVYNILQFILQHNDNARILSIISFRTSIIQKSNEWFDIIKSISISEICAREKIAYLQSMECMLRNSRFACNSGICSEILEPLSPDQ